MLNHSGVCLSLFLVESALFSEPQCSHAPRCYALLLVQLRVYVESSLPLCRTEAVLTSSLPSVLVQHFVFPCFWDFCPFPFPSFHASNTAPYFRISRFQFPWLIVPFNITFSAESIELCLVFKTAAILCCPEDHISLLCSSFPLHCLSASVCRRGVAAASSLFLSPTAFIFYLASGLKHTYWSKCLFFFF